MAQHEKIARIQKLRPIDDVFFEVLASDKPFVQEMLRVILEDKNLVVEDVIVQSDERNIYGRSVRLDALCYLSNGVRCNIEVQRFNNDNHLKRARFNASVITAKDSETGTAFTDIPDLYIVYVSEFDFLEGNLPIYHVDKVIRETNTRVDDGLYEIFVNTVPHGSNTDIEEYMSLFLLTEVDNPKYPAITNAVKSLKSTKGGLETMCNVMEEYMEERVRENRMKTIQTMLANGIDKQVIVISGFSEEEIKMAEENLLAKV